MEEPTIESGTGKLGFPQLPNFLCGNASVDSCLNPNNTSSII